MKITGELLKSERVNKNLTVKQVADSLKLSSKIINAMENGDISQLPAKTFVRGFVKSYAEFLKLDSDVVLRQFQEEMGSTIPLPKVPPPMPSENSESFKAGRPAPRHTSQNYTQPKSVTSASIKQQNIEAQNQNSKIVIFLIGAVVLVLLIVGGTKLFQSDADAVVSTPEVSNVVIPNHDTATSVSETAATSTANTKSEVVAVSQTTNLTGSASSTTPAAVAALTEDDIAASTGKPVELILEAKRDIEIFYAKGNTKNFKSLKLTANKVQIIRSSTGLHLKASDGGAFKITANGIEIGNAGANNKPVKLTY